MAYEDYEARQTMKGVIVSTSIMSLFFVSYLSINLTILGTIYGIGIALLLNTVLFAGEYIQFFVTQTRDFGVFIDNSFDNVSDMLKLKMYIVAPIVEEVVYRGMILNILLDTDVNTGEFKASHPRLIIISHSLFFSISHLHHIFKRWNAEDDEFKAEIARRAFQMVFTTIFGIYSGYVYWAAGFNIIAPITLHMY